ncbi:DivIVA domain-containing protein [Fructilactobacillus carniphilus]|uniref:DivIVA domain-containing protein n=1 Tax=Fructilactobacillus carniphilus TaxID=2940297 RepID=A0ABY5BYJ1_9LACO|nr:DivIVA domain-containing protein [Fructilactobacillus carniphilus]USS90900.1 DivIVA domain-containing protein [Fructilactobacillus carniphilus]
MVLSAEDIHNKKFNTKMRGYNIDEVNDFLEQIIKDYQILRDENESLKQDLDDTKNELSHYDDLKGSLNESILVAQDAADRVKKAANADAEKTMQEAQEKANQLLTEAMQTAQAQVEAGTKQAAALALSTDDFRTQLQRFQKKMVAMLESQLQFANQSDWSELLKGADYRNFPEMESLVESLDNSEAGRVNSESNQPLSSDKYADPTIRFYPDGQIEIL